jgi:hypothetical protein
MSGLRSILPLSRDSLRGIQPAKIAGQPPTVEWVNPRSIFIEENYQRDVGENGTALIRRIVAEFSWHKFKSPICFRAAEHGDVLVAVDGQHTSIACATLNIEAIPVLVYSDATLADRAAAFVAHNRDKLALTMQAIFKADLAAGDAVAVAAARACEAAGAKILTHAISLATERPVGETMAVGTIRSLLRKKGEPWVTRVMRVLVRAGRGPIKAQEIGGVSLVLEKVGAVDDRLVSIVRSKTAKQWAALGAAEAGTLPQALATLWLRALGEHAAPAAPGLVKPVAQSVKPIAAPAKPIAQPVNLPPPPAPYSAPYSAPPPKPRAPIYLVQSNGVRVAMDGHVEREGHDRVVTVSEEGARLIARLVSVMPAQISFERLAQHVYQRVRPNGQMLLEDLVATVRPRLAAIGLEIFKVQRSGYMIRELANNGENLLRA